MHVIITGATGFLGSALLKTLVQDKHTVTVIARDADKIDQEILDKITVIECSLQDFYSLKIDMPCDVDDAAFYHFAWEGTTGSARGDDKKQLHNIEYACEALRLAVRSGCTRFINAGSLMAYEAMKNMTMDGYRPGINSIYTVSKLAADFMLKAIAADAGIQYNNVIISNVYGPGEKSERFLNSTLRKMICDEPIEMTEGLQLYDFIYLDDAIRAIIAVGLYGEPFTSYYIGNKKQQPLREYVKEMKMVLKSNSELKFGAVPFNGVGLTYKEFDTGSIEKIGIIPQISFSEGILKTKEWIQRNE